jgi:holo-[acyl-carrier protein] synthase
MVPMRAGVDLVSVAAVRDSLEEHGEHYLRRVYTERERQECTTPAGVVDPERLAARFAAKEAMLKILRPGSVGLPLSAIEVQRQPGGWVELGLSGAAATLAAEIGIGELALSITHEAGYASAVVVAVCA